MDNLPSSEEFVDTETYTPSEGICTETRHEISSQFSCYWCHKMACLRCSRHSKINNDITKTGRMCDICWEDDEDVSRD